MVHFEAHAEIAQPLDPAAQERGSFERLRIDPAAGGLEGFHAQVRRPSAQRGGIEAGNKIFPSRSAARVAGDKALAGFAVGEVQPALPGDEKFPAYRGFSIIQRYLEACLGRHFSRAQPGRATADDGELMVRVQGRAA